MKCEKYLTGLNDFSLCPGNGVSRYASRLIRKLTHHSFVRLAQLLLLLFAAGCAIQPPVSDTALSSAWQENKLKLEQIHNWDLRGRIAIRLQKDNSSASLSWQQSEQDYVIRIIGPFGRGTLELEGNREGVTMRDADNQLLHARDPETLLEDYLGWQVPLTGLNFWIRGLPDPGVEIKTLVLDAQARISELTQADWQISYGRYMQVDELSLPQKLELQNQQLKVKVFIKQWELSP